METRNLGRTGVKVSPLCLGTMNFGGPTPEADSIRIIHRALDAGINFLDTANMYNAGESERVVGKALAGGRRPKVILATKVHFPQSDDPNDRGNSRRHILQAIEDSLRRLNTDWVDLYQIHRPVFDMPQDETLRALDDLVHQGKVRYIGCSTFPAWMVMEALALSERYGLARYVTEQPPTICSTAGSRTSSCRWRCAMGWDCSPGLRSRWGCSPAATASRGHGLKDPGPHVSALGPPSGSAPPGCGPPPRWPKLPWTWGFHPHNLRSHG